MVGGVTPASKEDSMTGQIAEFVSWLIMVVAVALATAPIWIRWIDRGGRL